FTSDNGGLYHWWIPQETDDLKYYKPNHRGQYVKDRGHQGNAHLRGTKADIWEGGHRVPFIVRWPGHTPSDSTSDELVELTDLLATCAAITNQKLPAGAGEDSVNILPALLGETRDKPLRDYAIHHSLWGHFSVRQGPWKMVPKRGSGGFTRAREVKPAAGEPTGQLYNLKQDPSETRNVWNEHPDVVKRLSAILEKVQNP
ncbi:MAG: sulfatase-like hydrolase/transferase, partial [Planctomycetaceae bacterium]|nr:sulfatase-like hydrolase/transferase [Planctomycetaceae bacterium]